MRCRNLCSKHYRRWLRYGDPLGGKPSPVPSPLDGLCTIDDCNILHYAHGWCEMHYARWRRSGDPLVARKRRKAPVDGYCTVFECKEQHLARGLCNMHYQRWRAHGDPLIFLVTPSGPGDHQWKGMDAGYLPKHRRVETARGKAKFGSCIWEDLTDNCKGIMDWANMTGNYDSVWDFEPMCRKHHNRYDGARRRCNVAVV